VWWGCAARPFSPPTPVNRCLLKCVYVFECVYVVECVYVFECVCVCVCVLCVYKRVCVCVCVCVVEMCRTPLFPSDSGQEL